MIPCVVPNCVNHATDGGRCLIHLHAKEHDGSLIGRCWKCNRLIRKGDWISREPKQYRNRRRALKIAYGHIACAIKVPAMKRAEQCDLPWGAA